MISVSRRRNRIILAVWLLLLLVLFFYRGDPAVTLILLFTVIYLIVAFVYVRLGGKTIRVDLSGGDMVEKSEPMGFHGRITNEGRMPVFCCTCEIEAKNLLTGTGEYRPTRVSLGAKATRECDLTLEDECCGRIRLNASHITIEDPLRIFAAERKADGEDSQRECEAAGIVLPQIHERSIPEGWLDSYNMESYQYSQVEKGSDPGEVFGVREYREGDSQKQIHWKLSAKLDEMTVKIPSFPIENNILVILDNLLEEEVVMDAEARSSLVEDLCSLSTSLTEKDIPHSIGWYDTEKKVFVQRRVKGQEDLLEALPELLSCGFEVSEVSAVYRYLESGQTSGYTNHFIVTAQEGRDTERLEGRGAVKVFRKKQ